MSLRIAQATHTHTYTGSASYTVGLSKVYCLRHRHNPLRRVNRILGRRKFTQVSCVSDVSGRNANGIQDRVTL